MTITGINISCRHCGHSFWMCRSCYRGQRYCSEKCRETGYKERRRAARRKNESSPEGRLNHRDRQQEYRDRQKIPHPNPLSSACVPDNTSDSQKNILNPLQQSQSIAAQREAEIIFGITETVCTRCGCKITHIYRGIDETFKKTRQ